MGSVGKSLTDLRYSTDKFHEKIPKVQVSLSLQTSQVGRISLFVSSPLSLFRFMQWYGNFWICDPPNIANRSREITFVQELVLRLILIMQLIK